MNLVTAFVIVLIMVGIIIITIKIFKKKYNYYTIEIWGEIPVAGTDEYAGFPEEEKGPNLRQSIKTGKWEVGREAYSYFMDRHYYLWQPIGDRLAHEILKKIRSGKPVQVLLKDDNEAIIAA